MATLGKIPLQAEIGIRVCNSSVVAIEDHSGTGAITGAAYMGPIRKAAAGFTTYAGINKAMLTSANVNDTNNIVDEFTSIADQFNRNVYIRDNGSGSAELFCFIENDADKLDGFNLIYAARHFPDGITSTAAAAGTYDPVDDDAALIGSGTAYPRYNIVVESKVDVAAVTKYRQTIFKGVRIKVTQQYQTQRGVRLTLEWEDAREIEEIEAAGTSLITYINAA